MLGLLRQHQFAARRAPKQPNSAGKKAAFLRRWRYQSRVMLRRHHVAFGRLCPDPSAILAGSW